MPGHCRSSPGRGLPYVDEMVDGVLDTAGEVQERLSSLLEPPEGQNLQLASLHFVVWTGQSSPSTAGTAGLWA